MHLSRRFERPTVPPPTDSGPDLPYRLSVGIMLLNCSGLVWLGRRQPKWLEDRSQFIWQMPQGGIQPDEAPREAALRELREETGFDRVEVLAEYPLWLTYDLPQYLIGIALKGRFRGQRQRWFCMRFAGADRDISTDRPGLKREFDDWRWAGTDEVLARAPVFKRGIYGQVISAFADWLEPPSGSNSR
jgi:putative (di)nucleoside polyphosphate hydrolase